MTAVLLILAGVIAGIVLCIVSLACWINAQEPDGERADQPVPKLPESHDCTGCEDCAHKYRRTPR